MISPPKFPTELHREVAELAGDFFSAHAQVDTILVVNSCARGRAVTGSDLDLTISKWRSATASRMRPRFMRRGRIFDSFSRNGCHTMERISD